MKWLRELWFAFLLLGIWSLVSGLHWVPSSVLPSPITTVALMSRRVMDGSILLALMASGVRIIIGYAIALMFGLSMGLLASATKDWSIAIPPVFLGMLSLPSVAYVPFALLWFGATSTAVIAVIVIVASIPMSLAAISGAQAVRRSERRAARVLGARRLFFVRRVTLPAAMPSLLLGAKQTWAYAWRGLLSGELFMRSGIGLGRTLDSAKNHGDVPTMIAVLVIVVALAQGVDSLVFRSVEQKSAHTMS